MCSKTSKSQNGEGIELCCRHKTARELGWVWVRVGVSDNRWVRNRRTNCRPKDVYEHATSNCDCCCNLLFIASTCTDKQQLYTMLTI